MVWPGSMSKSMPAFVYSVCKIAPGPPGCTNPLSAVSGFKSGALGLRLGPLGPVTLPSLQAASGRQNSEQYITPAPQLEM